MSRWRTRHRRIRSERGAAAVEFAIVLVVLLLILLGIIDFGRLLFVRQAVEASSREAARAAVVASGNGQTVYNAARNSGDGAASLAGGSLVVTVKPQNGTLATLDPSTLPAPAHNVLCPPNTSDFVTVGASVDFNWLTPVGGLAGGAFGAPKDVSDSTTMRCEGT